FGGDPMTVSMFVEASIKVSKRNGLLSCAKHFPGLGAAIRDPHKKIALASYDEIVWRQREMIPFRTAVENGVDIIMTTHMHIPKLDNKIVTGSETIISNLLRKNLAFDGPIITDDLTMAGASMLGDIGERTVAAFNAGHDLLLFGRDYEEAFKAYDYFTNACERGEISKERIDAALDRVTGIKFKLKASVIH
ncbi:MAG: glycoside hydrolase family 3 N-terminal domain-containing protein, partial [Candidatus Zixiibacteriota bacterium]